MRSPGWVALGHSFTVQTPVAELDRYLSDLLADLPASRGTVDHAYRLDGPDAEGRWVARIDDEVIEEGGAAARALALLLWRINRGVIEDTDDLILLHAGGVIVDGAAILLPGDMEVGKTTLVTGLLCAGADYLSDEAIGLGLDDADAHGYGKALSLDPGSWPLFPELEPETSDVVRPFLPHQWQIRASSIPGVEVVDHAPVRAVVLPSYRAGAELEVRRLGGAKALLHLAGCVFPTSIPRRRTVERLARLLDHVPCYALVYSDLAAGVDLVVSLVRDGDRAEHLPVASTAQRTLDGSTGTPARNSRVDEGRPLARRRDAALISVGDEWVIHVAGTDDLHRVDALGAAVWQQLDGQRTMRALIEQLASSSAQEEDAITAALLAFVGDLMELDLVE